MKTGEVTRSLADELTEVRYRIFLCFSLVYDELFIYK